MAIVWWISALFLLVFTQVPSTIILAEGKTLILFTDADAKSTNVMSLDANHLLHQILFYHNGDHRPIALDLDHIEHRVYWTDSVQGRIMSAFINATSVKTLFRCNVKKPEGLAIDHVGRKIYWTDTGTNRIEVGTLDGKSRKLLFKDGLDEPRAIVLDQINGMVYWSDWGANPKIERAGMDGSARQTIVTGNLIWPNGLTIYQAIKRLYWADAKLDKIEVSDLDGRNRQLIMSSVANIHPFGLAVYENVLYWTDWNNKSISSHNLSSGITDVVLTGLQKPMDIHVIDSSSMLLGPHACSQSNGFCSDLCLLKPGGHTCACPTGMADRRTCDYDKFHKSSSEKFLIFADADFGEIYQVPLAVPGTPCSPLGIKRNISGPIAVDYDPVEGKIYWTDVSRKLVARAFPNGSSVEVIAKRGVHTPVGLALDYVGRTIFWTDHTTHKIEVARLDGSFRRALIASDIEEPRAIILDMAERKIYWTARGSSPKIEQANMNGSVRKLLVSSRLVGVNSLALDYQNRLLYWCDEKLGNIERVDLQGNNRKIILHLSVAMPFGLALSDDVLYWTDHDWRSKSVHRYNITSSVLEVVVSGMSSPMELHIYDHKKPFYVIPCPQLTSPVNGSMQCSNLPGQTCQFYCSKGYNLTGSATRKCSSDGTWNGTQPKCNEVHTDFANNTETQEKYNDKNYRKDQKKATRRTWYIPLLALSVCLVFTAAIGVTTFYWRTYRVGGRQNHAAGHCDAENAGYVLDDIDQNSEHGSGQDAAQEVQTDATICHDAIHGGSVSTVEGRDDNERDSQDQENHAAISDCFDAENGGYIQDDTNQNLEDGSSQGTVGEGRSDAATCNGVIQGGSALPSGKTEGKKRDSDDQEISDISNGVSLDSGHYYGNDDEPVTELQCLNISPHVGVHWKNVLRKLSMAEMIIDTLEEDHKHSKVTEKCYKGLLKWKESIGPQKATTKKLSDALRRVPGCSQALEVSLWKEDTADISDC